MIPLPLSDILLAKLRARRAARGADDIERERDAFCLYPGMGPAIYLTSDGRILWDHRGWDGDTVDEITNEDGVITSLVVGAKTVGFSELLEFLPARSADAVTCPMCEGSGWLTPWKLDVICTLCHGRTWATPAMIERFGPIWEKPRK